MHDENHSPHPEKAHTGPSFLPQPLLQVKKAAQAAHAHLALIIQYPPFSLQNCTCLNSSKGELKLDL